MAKANAAVIEWNRKNPNDPVCVHTEAMLLAGIHIGDDKCGLEASTLFGGGYGTCIRHKAIVRELYITAVTPNLPRRKAVR